MYHKQIRFVKFNSVCVKTLRYICYVTRVKVTCCMSRMTCHALPVTRYLSRVTCHALPVTCYPSRVTCHALHVTCCMSRVTVTCLSHPTHVCISVRLWRWSEKTWNSSPVLHGDGSMPRSTHIHHRFQVWYSTQTINWCSDFAPNWPMIAQARNTCCDQRVKVNFT